MNFTIKSILLWPKNEENSIRRIDFEIDKINVITGGSEKGKSAIIAIIDYCLGSSHCRIPTRTIRDTTQWFGILINLKDNQQLLLARQEPGYDTVSGDMYMKAGDDIEVPERIVSNCNVEDVKHRLNDLANLPYISFDDFSVNSGFQARPSFRDMVSFVFQPQYIVANQSSLYYKSDSSKHREKLKTIFPYVLKAVDNEYLELRKELRDNERDLLALERELEGRRKVSQKWVGEIRANYSRAKEYGLLNNAPYSNDDWTLENYLQPLRAMTERLKNNEIPLIPEGATTITSNRIVELQNQEIQVAHEIQNLRRRQELIKKIEASNRGYRNTLIQQYSRLDSINWFNKQLKEKDNCPFCDTETNNSKKYIDSLISINQEIIDKGYKTNDHYTALNDELDKINTALISSEKSMNLIRNELKGIQSKDQQYDKRIQTINSIYKFIGHLEAELNNYDAQLNESDLALKILKIQKRIIEISEKINQGTVDNKILRAKAKISTSIKHYAKIFQAANNDEYIDLNIKDLTLNFISKNGKFDALYEIGSGSNYMAYHISTLLALHEFFLKYKDHPVPNFIIFDQPSQAYFPDTDVEFQEKNEDIGRVRRIFEALESANQRTKGNLQIIVLEHVGQFAWENFDNVNLVKRWRDEEDDNALINRDWLN